MAVLTRANFADLLDPAFREIFTNAEKALPVKYTELFNIHSSSKNIEKDSSVSGLAQMAKVSEGEAITSDEVLQGYDVTYTHDKFGRKTTITEEMIEDDQFRMVEARAKGLATSLNRTVETSGADLFKNGFTAGGGGISTFQSGQDGAALFSTAHTRTDGGANLSNTTTSDLAEDSLEAAIVAMSETLDDRGQLMVIQPSRLLVPPALEKEARILLETNLRTGTANNDINVFNGRLNLTVWHYIGAAGGGSDTAWYILDDSSHMLNWFWRRKPAMDTEVNFDTGNTEFKLTARWSNGYADWRGTYASQGDNS